MILFFYYDILKKTEDERLIMDLRSAVISGTTDDLKQALSTGEPANHIYSEKVDRSTPIHWAAYNKFNDKLELLCQSLSSSQRRQALNLPNMYNVTPLFEAVWVGPNPDIADKNPHLKQIEKHKWRENYNNRLENMPKTVEILLKYGANPFDTTKARYWGNTQDDRKALDFYEFISFQQQSFAPNSVEYKALAQCQEKINQARLLTAQKRKFIGDTFRQ